MAAGEVWTLALICTAYTQVESARSGWVSATTHNVPAVARISGFTLPLSESSSPETSVRVRFSCQIFGRRRVSVWTTRPEASPAAVGDLWRAGPSRAHGAAGTTGHRGHRRAPRSPGRWRPPCDRPRGTVPPV